MKHLLAVALVLLAACGTGPAAGQAAVAHATPVAVLPSSGPAWQVSPPAGAAVAWFVTPMRLVGLTPAGGQPTVAGLAIGNASNEGVELRSSDGGRLFASDASRLVVADALDGATLTAVDLPSAGPLRGSISQDGRWLWLLAAGSPTKVVVIDLPAARVIAQGSVPIGQQNTCCPFQGALIALNSSAAFIVENGGKEIALLTVAGATVGMPRRASGSAIACNSPEAGTLREIPDGSVVAYCPFDGTVVWIDPSRLATTHQERVRIGNPFWGSPAFSKDGRLLVVYDSWGGYVTALDLAGRQVLASNAVIPPVADIRLPGVRDVFAKGPNYSATLSADGQRLFVVGPHNVDGVFVIDTSSLAMLHRWMASTSLWEVWTGGDSGPLLAIEPRTNRLHVLDSQTGAVRATLQSPGELAVS